MKAINQVLEELSLEKHLDKTVAKKTFENFIEKASRIYEQDRRTP